MITIAIAIGFVTWPRTPRLDVYSYGNPYNRNYRPGGSHCAPSALASIRNSRKRTRDTETCSKEAEEYRQNTGNLIQQTRSADATYAQSQIAAQGLWTAWFQTIGGFITLIAAIAAALYAREAAREAHRGGNIAQTSNRAWMAFDEIGARRLLTPEGSKTLALNIWVKFMNVGNSPALKTMCHIQIEFVDAEGVIKDFVFPSLPNVDRGYSVIGPTKMIGPGPATIDRETYGKIFRRETFALINAGVEYTDFFTGERRITENHFQFLPMGSPDVIFSQGDAPLSSQFLGIGNNSRST